MEMLDEGREDDNLELISETVLPARADAVVIGAGIVGLCTALNLLRTGRDVVVVDRNRAGSGASGHNGGVIARGECVPLATGDVIRSVPRMLVDPLSAMALRW